MFEVAVDRRKQLDVLKEVILHPLSLNSTFPVWVVSLFDMVIKDIKIQNMLLNLRKTTYTILIHLSNACSQFEISNVIDQPLKTFATVFPKCNDELTEILLLLGICNNQQTLLFS